MRLPWGLTTRHVVFAALGLLSIAVCAFSAVVYRQYEREQSLKDYSVYQYETMRQSQLILMDLIDMETGVRGYAMSGDKRFLEPYTRAKGTLHAKFVKLRDTTMVEPRSFAGTDRWLDGIEALQNQLTAQISDISAHGRGAVSNVELDRQKATMDGLRVMLESSIAQRFERLKDRTRKAHIDQNRLFYLLFVGDIIAIAIMFGVAVLIIRRDDDTNSARADAVYARQRFDMVMNGVNDGVFEVNFINDTMTTSHQFKAMLGYDEDEGFETAQSTIEVLHPDDREAALNVLHQYATRKIPQYVNTFRMQQKDGSWRWILSRGIGTWDRFGQIRSLIGTHTDITEQKRREEELRQVHADMESFTYITSHDMRAPLVNLKGFSHELQLAMDEISAMIPTDARPLDEASRLRLNVLLREDVPESLGFIGNAVDRMDTLTTAILDLSRIGRFAYRSELVSARTIFDKCLGAQRYEIDARRIDIALGDLPNLITDPLAMEQIFSNLLDNAVKYLVPDRPGKIEVGCRQTSRDYIFFMKDNGRGIEPDDAERVFHIFRRARNAGEVRGQGLGMAFVKATLRKLSGAIWYDSQPGVGTTFYVSLPKKAAAPAVMPVGTTQ